MPSQGLSSTRYTLFVLPINNLKIDTQLDPFLHADMDSNWDFHSGYCHRPLENVILGIYHDV